MAVGEHFALVHAPRETVVDRMLAWGRERHGQVAATEIEGSFPELLAVLVDEEPVRDSWQGDTFLVVGLPDGWTAVYETSDDDNLFGGVGIVLSGHRHRLSTIQVKFAPEFRPPTDRAPTGIGFAIHDPGRQPTVVPRRSVAAQHFARQWRFDTFGEVQPFEDEAAYGARLIRDRLTPDLLRRYLEALGTGLPEEIAPGRRAVVVRWRERQQFTEEQERAAWHTWVAETRPSADSISDADIRSVIARLREVPADEMGLVWNEIANAGDRLAPYLLDEFARERIADRRRRYVAFAIPLGPTSDVAVELARRALADRSWIVRDRALFLLAGSQRSDVLPALRDAADHADPRTAATARAAIAAIERGDPSAIVDPSGSGRIGWGNAPVAQTGKMTANNVYQPGVCNIGPAEIRQRRMSGYVGLAIAVVFLVLAFAFGWPAWVRLLVALPVALAATGFLQSAFHFCVRFGTQGLFNFGELGTQEAVHEAEYRRKDQREALLIVALTAGIAAVVAVAAFLVPLG